LLAIIGPRGDVTMGCSDAGTGDHFFALGGVIRKRSIIAVKIPITRLPVQQLINITVSIKYPHIIRNRASTRRPDD
jgi:hypothetical protein